jgi:hypothetical protein
MYSTGIVVTSLQDHGMIIVVPRGNTGNNELGTEEEKEKIVFGPMEEFLDQKRSELDENFWTKKTLGRR